MCVDEERAKMRTLDKTRALTSTGTPFQIVFVSFRLFLRLKDNTSYLMTKGVK